MITSQQPLKWRKYITTISCDMEEKKYIVEGQNLTLFGHHKDQILIFATMMGYWRNCL